MFGRSGECLYGVWKVSERSLEGVWKVIGSFLDQLEIQSKFNLLSTLTWDFTMIKMKTFTWNSSVALLSPTCFVALTHYIHALAYYQILQGGPSSMK